MGQLDPKPNVLYMTVERLNSLSPTRNDLFIGIPIDRGNSFLKGYFLTFFIHRDPGIDQPLRFVILAPPDKKVNAKAVRRLHKQFFDVF
jgi:hypothetical protein